MTALWPPYVDGKRYCRLILLRHGSTASNLSARWHGSEDEPISDIAAAEADYAGARLAVHFRAERLSIITSHLLRAAQTAEIMAQHLPAYQVIEEPLLRERNMGDWVGMSPAEVEQLWPGMLPAWESGKIGGPPGGESDYEVAKRARRGLARHAELGASLIVVTHGGVIRSLCRDAGLPNLPVPHFGGYTAVLDESGDLRLLDPVQFGRACSAALT
jgi:probable phosphoglycerate mutase